jgi:hypothetical protein
MALDKTRQQENQPEKGRRPYQAPRLTVYGAMRDLTASGTESTAEHIRNGVYVGPGRP